MSDDIAGNPRVRRRPVVPRLLRLSLLLVVALLAGAHDPRPAAAADPAPVSSTDPAAEIEIGTPEGAVTQSRPDLWSPATTTPPMGPSLGPSLGPSPTIQPSEWSAVGLAVLLTVTPLVTVAALFWLGRKPLPAHTRTRS